MRKLPNIDDRLFPAHTRRAVRNFWFAYWAWFFLLLPWMLIRQAFVSLHQLLGAVWTWNRRVDLLDGSLTLVFMTSAPSLAVTLLFGERFTAIRYRDVLIDPGPLLGRRRLADYLRDCPTPIRAIVATHAHEEHIGNTGLASALTGAPVYATPTTLAAINTPEVLSAARPTFIGQPERMEGDLRRLGASVETDAVVLQVVESPGHCDGHASVLDTERGVLFAGDSFMHTVFTSPNKDVSGDDESGRLFSAGEFSRTFFVRSLSRTPDRVPARFPPFVRLVDWVGRLATHRH